MAASDAFLWRCVPTAPVKLPEPGKDEAFQGLSNWRLATMQESLCELMRQQGFIQHEVGEIAEMQRELRVLLQQSKERLAELGPATPSTPCGAAKTAHKGSFSGMEAANSELKARTSTPQLLPADAEQPSRRVSEKVVEADQERVKAFMTTRTAKRAEKKNDPFPRLRAVVSNPFFDVCMGVLIMLNFASIFLEVELKAMDLETILHSAANPGKSRDLSAGFNGIEATFNAIFTVELLLRLLVFGRNLFTVPLDVFDAGVTVISAVDSFILKAVLNGGSETRILALLRVTKILRAMRLLRFLRVLRLMSCLSPLRVLVHTIALSMDSLVWSLLVMACIITASGLLVANLVADYLADESVDVADREWVFLYFGSATRASYTMFEATFSGIWASRLSRKMIEELSPWFMLFWCCYTCTVSFAVVRVVSTLFLKRTLDVAQIDAERIALAKMEEKERAVATIREIFRVADQSGDGVLTRWEFDEMMENDEVLGLFEEVELEAPELHLLFTLLQDGGNVDQDEFLAGAMKLKNQQVKLIDIIQVHHEQASLKRRMEDIKEGIEHVSQTLNPDQAWCRTWSNAHHESRGRHLALANGGKSKTAVADHDVMNN